MEPDELSQPLIFLRDFLLNKEVNSADNKEILQFSKYDNVVFVSYADDDESEKTVDELNQVFAENDIQICRDTRDLEYRGSIKEFEERIGQGQCVVLVINDKYLRSEHCMYELVEVAKNREMRKRIFPIVLNDANIYDAIGRVNYITYWEAKIRKLNEAIRNIDILSNLEGITDDLNKYQRIRANFANLSDLLRDMKALTPDVHRTSGFSSLVKDVESRLNKKFGLLLDDIFSNSSEGVNYIKRKLAEKDQNSHEYKPYYNLLLAYSYRNIESSILYAERAESEFGNGAHRLGEIVSGWLLALLRLKHRTREVADQKKEEVINEIFQWKRMLRNNDPNNHNYDSFEKVIEDSYEKVSQQFSNAQNITPPSISTRMRWNKSPNVSTKPGKSNDASLKKDDKLPEQPQSPISQKGNRRSFVHITIPIPIDIGAIEDLLDPESPSDEIVFNSLKDYNLGLTGGSLTARDLTKEVESNITSAPPKYKGIPPYPIYGTATGGLSGQAFLEPTDEVVKASTNINHVIIREREYKVIPTNNAGRSINFIGNITLGWLKVIGDSMNAAKDTPINNCCYVLFRANCDPNSCIGRIVIAELPDDITQPPQLVVKRLIKKSDTLFLHSESSLEIDPITGKRFDEDLELVRDNQVKAVVIAVATPVKCTLT